ncbi:TPA: ANR family transcriptional regulator [Escherichia coli]|uniref:ANR family transcriptional regulator n=1 Tax=Escherichia coli TaxID=562 RepID=UPI000E1D9D18|nr:ANR family transcriptional regulator [Escherichia coli O5]HBA7339341.1 ANR family transcriptional regulator [Escherichia coli]
MRRLQKINVIKKMNIKFHKYAQLAAKAERAKDYEYAIKLWRKAALVSTNNQNIDWVLCRINFCTRHLR